MQTPLEIQFRNMDASEAVEARARERATALERLHDRITGCQVVVEAPHRHHQKGGLYSVRIRITVPGGELLVNRGGGPQNHAHEDVYVALRDAFDAAERKLEDRTRRRDHRTRAHEPPLHGKVIKHFGAEGYGFVETSDGLEAYFHENSVVGGRFEDLAVGDEVRIELAVGESDRGPQATTIRPIGKHHLVP